MRGDGADLRLGCGHGDAGLHASDGAEGMVAALAERFGVHRQRHPDVHALGTQMKTGRHNTDHRGGLTIERNGLANHAGAATEAAFPEVVAEHDDIAASFGVGLILARQESAAEFGMGAQQAEKVRGYAGGGQPLRLAAAGQVEAAVAAVQRHVAEQLALSFPVGKIGPRKRIAARRRLGLIHRHQLVGLGERQRLQQDSVHQAEHGGVGADSQRQHNDGNGGEAGRVPQPPPGVAEILSQSHMCLIGVNRRERWQLPKKVASGQWLVAS